MKIYLYIGIIILIGLILFFIWNSKQNLNTKDIVSSTTNVQEVNRNLKLIVSYDYGENLKTISEKPTQEIIITTMQSIDWNKFHIVQLEDHNGNALHVSGSLADDGLSSGYVTEDDHILKVDPPESVNEMTDILLTFLESEANWRSKYKFN